MGCIACADGRVASWLHASRDRFVPRTRRALKVPLLTIFC